MIKYPKKLKESFSLINDITKTEKFSLQIGKTKKHSYNDREVTLSKINDTFKFQTSIKIKPGLQVNSELKVSKTSQVVLTNNERSLYTLGKYFLINKIDYKDEDPSHMEKLIEGSISVISTKFFDYYNIDRFYRIILPIPKRVRLHGNFTGWTYSVDGKQMSETLIKMDINDKEFHFYPINKDGHFIVIDSISKQNLEGFLKIANSILLSYAFIKGDYFGEEAFVFSYKDATLEMPSSLKTIILGGGNYNGFPVHTTNPYSILALKTDTKYKKDLNGKITGIDNTGFNKYMVEFPSESLSNLAQLICNEGGILRTVILLVSNNSASFEIKIPMLFVALENITRVLTGGDKAPPKLIETPEIIADLKKIVKASTKEISQIEKKYLDSSKNEFEVKEYKSTFERIRGKFHGFNNGTNNKKLAEPYLKFGYKLSSEEEKLIFVERNKFLHGEDFMSLEDSFELEFRELFHISMRLHKLITVLLLKKSSFSGYIINNPKLYEYITERKLREKYFEYI